MVLPVGAVRGDLVERVERARLRVDREPQLAEVREAVGVPTPDLGAAATLLRTATDVTLLAHVNPDADALGSALALGLALHRRGVDVRVSFGMPGRHVLNGTFLSMAMTAGLTSAIMDTRTPEVVSMVKATDLLMGHDEWGMAWISRHRAAQAQAQAQAQAATA